LPNAHYHSIARDATLLTRHRPQKGTFARGSTELQKTQSEQVGASQANGSLVQKTPLRKANTRESDLDRRERIITAKEKQFETKLLEAKKKIQEENQSIKDKKEILEKREADLAIRLRELEDLEIAANAGFAKQNQTALNELKAQHSALLGKVAALEQELVQKQTTVEEELNQFWEQETEKRRQRLETEMQKRRVSEENELDQRREVAEKEFTRERNRMAKEDELIKERWLELEKKWSDKEQELLDRERNLKAGQRELTADRALLDQEYRDLQDKIRNRAEIEVRDVQEELNRVTTQNQELLKARTKLEDRLTDMQDRYRWLDGKDPDDIANQIQYLKKETERLKGELSLRPQKEVQVERDELRKEKERWDEDHRNMFQQMSELRAQKSAWDMSVGELERMKNEKELAERQRDTFKAVLDAEMAKFKKEFERVQRLYSNSDEWDARVEAICQPRFTPEELNREQANGHVSEIDWLSGIQEDCKRSKLTFNKRILWAFHTSLKIAEWSPLTVLAGISGTGKSELPRLYARFGGLLFEPLAVQPNWDSPQSLFGFFNSVDNCFNATTLLQALVQSQKSPEDDGFNDFILLVLLDEMNLAYVELYFSDMLSLLEQRRGKQEPEELKIDLGARMPKFPVPLGLNVIWTGTMNQDETTKSLSDKVLDRGNIISFPRPTELKRREKLELGPERPLLPFRTWKKWQQDASIFSEEDIKPYKEVLDEMNRHLEFAGRAIGHRVWQSIEAFMANYPSVIQAKKPEDFDKAMKTAFEDQIVQKVMPKLRGIETTGQQASKCLEPIRIMLEKFKLNLSYDFERAMSSDFGGFNWNSAKYLESSE
jgi:hypothetical protein